MIVKHLYKRTITHRGKKVQAWYFWFYDQNKKQVRKSCGTKGKPCLLKREAEVFISQINDNDLIQQSEVITFNDFCIGMFAPDSQYLRKCISKGRVITEKTRKMKEYNLNLILQQFGDRPVNSVEPSEFDTWLLSFDRSNSWRNSFFETANEIYKELYLSKLVDRLPIFERFKVQKLSTKGILTPEEISRLFPSDPKELIRVWHKDNSDPEVYSYMFGMLFFIMVSTGMRSGEAQALKWDQFISDDTIILNAMISDGERVDHLKKGTSENKKWRIAILPDKAVKMLEYYKTICYKSEFVFEYHGKPVSGNYMNKRFKYILNKHGINTDERNLSVHSLRFTNDTISMRQISTEDLKLMLGHTKQRMTEYYDRSTALDHLPELMKNKDTINSLWN